MPRALSALGCSEHAGKAFDEAEEALVAAAEAAAAAGVPFVPPAPAAIAPASPPTVHRPGSVAAEMELAAAARREATATSVRSVLPRPSAAAAAALSPSTVNDSNVSIASSSNLSASSSPPAAQSPAPAPAPRAGNYANFGPPPSSPTPAATAGAGAARPGHAHSTSTMKPKSMKTIKRREASIAAARGIFMSQQLEIAFAVLDRMKHEGLQPDEIIYRALLDACGRLGNFGKAHQIFSELQAAGMAQDESLYRCVALRPLRVSCPHSHTRARACQLCVTCPCFLMPLAAACSKRS
ncbi:hypothetical protein EON62_00300 [archaeon]|nr:MAG: hypothetical protein EON62_00300 [archaeon]